MVVYLSEELRAFQMLCHVSTVENDLQERACTLTGAWIPFAFLVVGGLLHLPTSPACSAFPKSQVSPQVIMPYFRRLTSGP